MRTGRSGLLVAASVADLGAAVGPFQLVAMLAEPGLGLVTALDADGNAGCALLRVS